MFLSSSFSFFKSEFTFSLLTLGLVEFYFASICTFLFISLILEVNPHPHFRPLLHAFPGGAKEV